MCFGRKDRDSAPIPLRQPPPRRANTTTRTRNFSRPRPRRSENPAVPHRTPTVRAVSGGSIPSTDIRPVQRHFPPGGVQITYMAVEDIPLPADGDSTSTSTTSANTVPEGHSPVGAPQTQELSESGEQGARKGDVEGNVSGSGQSKHSLPPSSTKSEGSPTPSREDVFGRDARWSVGDRQMLPSVKARMQEEADGSAGEERR